jgi:hypothetical protein
MDRFDETAIVDTVYCLPIKEKKISFYVSLLQQTNRSVPFPVSVSSKQTEFAIFR